MSRKKYTIINCDVCSKEVDRAHEGCVEKWYYTNGNKKNGIISSNTNFDLCDDCYEKIMTFIDVLKSKRGD